VDTFFIELAGLVAPDGLENGHDVDIAAIRAGAGQDAATVDENTGDIEPGHCHDAARHVFVAATQS